MAFGQYATPTNSGGFRAGGYLDQDPVPGTLVYDSNNKPYHQNDHIKDWSCNDQANLSYVWCAAQNGKKATTYNNHSGWDIIRGWGIYNGGVWTDVSVVAPVNGLVEHADPLECPTDTCTDTTAGSQACHGCGGGFGNNVKIRDRFGNQVILGHMRYNSIYVAPTQQAPVPHVTCGVTVLGLVGSSGYSTTPHIHFQVNPTALGTPSEEPFSGDCKSADAYVAHTSFWTDQPDYCTASASPCYPCEVEPGARRHLAQIGPPLWYSANYGVNGSDSADERAERLGFLHAYGYTHYLEDAGVAWVGARPEVGCPADNGGTGFVHEVYGVPIQDFYQEEQPRRFPGADDGYTALAYNETLERAFLMRGGFWGTYKCIDADLQAPGIQAMGGAKFLGAPRNNEHKKEGAVAWQDFERGYMYFADNTVYVHFSPPSQAALNPDAAIDGCVGVDVDQNWPEGPICAPNPEVCNHEDDDGNGVVDEGCPATGAGIFRLTYTAPGCSDSLGVMGEVDDPFGNIQYSFWPPDMICGHEFTNAISCDIPVSSLDGGSVLGNVALALDGELHWVCESDGTGFDWYGGLSGEWDGSVVAPTIVSNGNGGCNFSFALPPATNVVVDEVCNGLDDDGNGQIDETFQCKLGLTGSNCVTSCGALGFFLCEAPACEWGATCHPYPEQCGNSIDDDCNGFIDCLDPACYTADQDGDGWSCDDGDCDDNNPSRYPTRPEVCNGLDEDCDGVGDDGNPGGGAACATGQPGVCGVGLTRCKSGSIVCEPSISASPELCDGLDNDCNGQVDDGNPGSGASCSTGLSGACDAGAVECVGGALTCVGVTAPTSETCDGLDNDCNGQVDDGAGACIFDAVVSCEPQAGWSVDFVHYYIVPLLPGPWETHEFDTNDFDPGPAFETRATIPAGGRLEITHHLIDPQSAPHWSTDFSPAVEDGSGVFGVPLCSISHDEVRAGPADELATPAVIAEAGAQINARRQYVADGRLPGVERLRRVCRVAASLRQVGFRGGPAIGVGMFGKDATDHEVIQPIHFALEVGDAPLRSLALDGR